MSPWSQLEAQPTQVSIAPAVEWPLGTYTTPGGSPDPWDQHCLQWYQEAQILIQAYSDYCRATHPEMTPHHSQDSDVTMAQMAAQAI